MKPHEIERTLKFIREQQAQTSALLQRWAERDGKMQSMRERLTELVAVESQRLNRHDDTFKAMQALHRESLSRLDQIRERLTRDR